MSLDPLGKVYPKISTEEYDKLKKELEEAKAEITALKAQHRKEIITALHRGIRCLKTDQDRNRSIDSFTNSNMTLEEVNEILDPLRDIPQDKRVHGYIH